MRTIRLVPLLFLLLFPALARSQSTLDGVSVPTALTTTGASVGGVLTGPTVTGVLACSGAVCDAIVVCVMSAANIIPTLADSGTCNGSTTVTSNISLGSSGLPVGAINLFVCNSPSAGSHTFTSTISGGGTAAQSIIAMRVSGVTSNPAGGGVSVKNAASSTTLGGANVIAPASSTKLVVSCGGTAISEASVGNVSTPNVGFVQQANVLGAAPSLFAQTAVGSRLQSSSNLKGGWSSMATATTSLALATSLLAAQQPTGPSVVQIDYIAEGDFTTLNGLSSANLNTPNSSNATCTGPNTPLSCCTGAGTGTCGVECQRVLLCAGVGVMVNPTCGATAPGTCPCFRVMGPTTYNGGVGSKATFLCQNPPGSGCLTQGAITCTFGTTITTGTSYVDSYLEPSGTCSVDGTPTSGSFIGVDKTFSATPASSGQISGIKLGDMVLRDICDVSSTDFGPPGFNPGSLGNPLFDTGTLSEQQTGDVGLITGYPVTAAGPATMPVENDVATQPGAVGVVVLSAALPSPGATPPLSRSSAAMSRRAH